MQAETSRRCENIDDGPINCLLVESQSARR